MDVSLLVFVAVFFFLPDVVVYLARVIYFRHRSPPWVDLETRRERLSGDSSVLRFCAAALRYVHSFPFELWRVNNALTVFGLRSRTLRGMLVSGVRGGGG